MSGIGAIFHLDGSAVPADGAQRMANALQLYGPLKKVDRTSGNFAYAWTQGGHFTPEDKFDQQPVGVGGRWTLLFTGFLLHRGELAEKLGIDSQRLQSLADSALVHAAWQKWQGDITLHLKGEYAVVITDSEAGRLYAFRSEGTATPIYYHNQKDRIVLASAPKGIFAMGDIPRELDEERIADALANNYDHKGVSYFRGLRSVPMGHMLEVGAGQVKVELSPRSGANREIRYANDDDYVAHGNELLDRSIASHMRSNVTPAATLSSGFDSSSVVVGMLEYLEQRNDSAARNVVSYTAVPAEGWDGTATGFRRNGDESGPVRAFAAMYPQLDARFLDSAELPIDHDLDKLLLLSEAPPMAINNVHWIINIYRHAREDGRNIVLTGASGNRTFSGTGRARYAKMLRQGRLLKLAKELKNSDNRGVKYWGIYKRAIMPNLPTSAVKMVAALRGDQNHAGWRGYSAAREDYVQDMRVLERAEDTDWDDSYRGHSEVRDHLERLGRGGARDNAQSLRYGLQALTGIQSRDPLGDPDITDFCDAIPDTQYMQNGEDRILIKRMMAGRLPAEIMNADRGRQAADWHMRMTRDLPRYREEVERMGDDADIAKRIDVPRLRKLLDSWPDKTPLTTKDHPDAMLAHVGLTRAIATSRFINWVKGKN